MRRMLLPEVKIKSKIADDQSLVLLDELEPYIENGVVIAQIIMSSLTVSVASNTSLDLIYLKDNITGTNYYIRNGGIITIKLNAGSIIVYGDFYYNNDTAVTYDTLYFDTYALEDLSINTSTNVSLDLYVIKN